MRWGFKLLLVFLIFVFASCEINIDVAPNSGIAPNLQKIDVNLFAFDNFSVIPDTAGDNYVIAAKIAFNNKEMVMKNVGAIDLYNRLLDQSPKFFAGKTWFWQNDTAVLYATYEADNMVYCEIFVGQDQDKKRLLWGTYNLDETVIQFYLPMDKDTFYFAYSDDYVYRILEFKSLSSPYYAETRSSFGEYEYIFYNNDTTYVHLSDDNSGRIKSYKYFNDRLWHCWDRFLQDDTCGADVNVDVGK